MTKEDMLTQKSVQDSGIGHWYDKEEITALDEEGIQRLNYLKTKRDGPVESRAFHYLARLSELHVSVPDFFRNVSPEGLFLRLSAVASVYDIPQVIVPHLVRVAMDYLDTGRLRPVIFVGERDSGMSTAVRLLIREAFQLPTEVIRVTQLANDGLGISAGYMMHRTEDISCFVRARLHRHSFLIAYVFDKIDKVNSEGPRANVDDEFLSITDESCPEIFDNFLETTIVGLEHCPMFFMVNDLQKVNPILAERCTVIRFPNAGANRIKSICKKYVDRKLKGSIYKLIEFDYAVMNQCIEKLVERNVTSLRKYQQLIEAVLGDAVCKALTEKQRRVFVTKEMFADAVKDIFGTTD